VGTFPNNFGFTGRLGDLSAYTMGGHEGIIPFYAYFRMILAVSDQVADEDTKKRVYRRNDPSCLITKSFITGRMQSNKTSPGGSIRSRHSMKSYPGRISLLIAAAGINTGCLPPMAPFSPHLMRGRRRH
jgi:hypothetical protein